MEFTFVNDLWLMFQCELGYAAVAESSISCVLSFTILKQRDSEEQS